MARDIDTILDRNNIEVFEVTAADLADPYHFGHEEGCGVGWYARQCFPGCLPEGDGLPPIGPCESEEEARQEAAEWLDDCDEDEDEDDRWEVIVGNVGTVYHGDLESTARTLFDGYCDDSRANYGRAAGESVTLMHNGEITADYIGTVDGE